MIALPRFLQFFAADRRRLGAVFLQSVAWLVAALMVGWVISGWFWQLMAPDPAPPQATAMIAEHGIAAQAVAARHLLGQTSSGGDDARADGNSVHLQLLGVMTASPEAAGFAILAEEGKPSVAAVEGETFMPGVKLVEVLPGQVRLRIGERIETIEVKERKGSTTASAPAAAEGSARSNAGAPSRRLRDQNR
jgi:hypothetical protein